MKLSIKQLADNRRKAFVAHLDESRRSRRFTGIQNAQEANIQESIEEIWCYVRENRNSLNATLAMSMIRTSIELALNKSLEVAAELLAEVNLAKEKNTTLIKANKELKKVIHANETNAERNEEHGHIAKPESERPPSHRDATEA